MGKSKPKPRLLQLQNYRLDRHHAKAFGSRRALQRQADRTEQRVVRTICGEKAVRVCILPVGEQIAGVASANSSAARTLGFWRASPFLLHTTALPPFFV